MDVAIIGAGVGGLTTACALHRVGVSCTVYEQAESATELGAGIQLAPNATRLLRRVGLGDTLEATAVTPRALTLRDGLTGEQLARTELGDACHVMFGAPYYTIRRTNLITALQSACDIDIRFGSRCTIDNQAVPGSPSMHPDKTYRLRIGDRRLDPEVIVGADGIRSAIRQEFIKDQPEFSGQSVYRGLAASEDVPAGDTEVSVWIGSDRHCVVYPIDSGATVNVVATFPSNAADAERWSAPGSVDEMRSAYQGWHPTLLATLSAVGSVTRWSLHDRPPVPRWGQGNVTLLGDAAHPMLPFLAQGANQAVEDAFAIGRALSEGGYAVAERLRRYERMRIRRVSAIQNASRANSQVMHGTHGGDSQSAFRREHELRNRGWLFAYDAERDCHVPG